VNKVVARLMEAFSVGYEAAEEKLLVSVLSRFVA
jgi:hypothetical protein